MQLGILYSGDRILHNHDMNGLKLIHSDCEYSVNLSDHAILIGIQML